MSYQAIVFDFGNIFLDLNYERCFDRFTKLLGFEISKNTVPEALLKTFNLHEMGKITDEEWIWAFQKINDQIKPREIIDAWNDLLIGVPSHRLPFIENVRKDYKVYMLSNINAVHEAWVDRHMKEVHKVDDFKNDYFDRYFYSHHLGMRKPNDDIYLHVEKTLEDDGIIDFLFIDDTVANVETAKRLGWKAVIHDPKLEITERLNRYLQL